MNKPSPSPEPKMNPPFDLQGHRGCRGFFPENSIPGFIHALDAGVNTLEMDVVISADSQVVVSHDPLLNPVICHDPNGKTIPPEEENRWNLFRMNYDEIRKCDCGSLGNPRFPKQQKMKSYKPLLGEVIDAAELHSKETSRNAPFYNIETKCLPSTDGINHPDPQTFTRLLIAVIREKGIEARTTIQSFDPRTLREAKVQGFKGTLAYLEEAEGENFGGMDSLGFKPDIYSPEFTLVDEDLVESCHQKGIKIIPWTVNDSDTAIELALLGVDGIITDYPSDSLRKQIESALIQQ